MADQTLQSLFGASPELVQQALRAQEQKNLLELSKMTPEQVTMYQSAAAGSRLGKALGETVGGIFGIDTVDPRLKQAQTAQGIINEVTQMGLDPNTPEFYREISKLSLQRGAPQFAQIAATQGGELEKRMAEIAEKQSQTLLNIKKTQAEASPFSKIDPSKYTPESLATYAQTGNVSDLRLNPESVGGGAKITFTQESKFAGQRGEDQAKALTLAASNATGAASAIATLTDMEKLAASNQLYNGPLAMTALGAANFLNSLGLISPADSRTLANSEIYDKKAKDLVMQELGGKLGAQISDTDRKFIEARIPQLTNSPTARIELIQKLKEIQQGKINLYRKMNEHANKFGQLNTFDFSQNYMPVGVSAAPLGTKENPIKLR